MLHPEFVPDFKGISDILRHDGDFSSSDVALVRANSALRDAISINQNMPSSIPFVPIDNFDSILPKDIETTGEFKRYFDYLSKKD